MVHKANTMRQSCTRIIKPVLAIKVFGTFSHDVTEAYLQSEDMLTRKLFLLPIRGYMIHFGISKDEILELLKLIYGMTDDGDYWGVTTDRHAKKDIGLEPLLGDPSLYIRHICEDIDGLMDLYVDDGYLAGNESMKTLTQRTCV